MPKKPNPPRGFLLWCGAMEARLLSFSEKRLAQLLRRAAFQHIRRELALAVETLGEAVFLVEWSNRPEWTPGLAFLREWESSVAAERQGLSPGTAPAAWIHLAQELAHLLENGHEWVPYLQTRWRVEAGRIGWSRRAAYAMGGFCALTLSCLILLLLARHAAAGKWGELAVGGMRTWFDQGLTFVLLFGRVAGTFFMLEHGVDWARKALTGRVEEPRVLFLGSPEGLALAEPPLT
jgi:hypothetical protein